MQAEKKQREIEIIELYNTSLLNNLLPNHVISHFLNPDITAVVSSCGKFTPMPQGVAAGSMSLRPCV